MDMPDMVVVEDVWGEQFEALSLEFSVRSDPTLWADRARLLDLVATSRALVVRNRTRVDAELFEAAPRLQLVGRAGVGLDNIDVAAADERGIVVVSPKGANARSVAEHALGAALALMRGLLTHDRVVREGRWDRHPGRELDGRIWGILGAGATGLAVAKLARCLGMSVIAYDPYVDSSSRGLIDAGVQLRELDEVCAAADVLSVHLPATPATTGLIGARVLALMRPETVLINVGRGEVVDEEALADALEHRRIFRAALDVRATEPPLRGRLERLDSVLLTPHIAGITEESQSRIMQAIADDVRAVLRGGEAVHAVGAVTRPKGRA